MLWCSISPTNPWLGSSSPSSMDVQVVHPTVDRTAPARRGRRVSHESHHREHEHHRRHHDPHGGAGRSAGSALRLHGSRGDPRCRGSAGFRTHPSLSTGRKRPNGPPIRTVLSWGGTVQLRAPPEARWLKRPAATSGAARRRPAIALREPPAAGRRRARSRRRMRCPLRRGSDPRSAGKTRRSRTGRRPC